MVTFKGVANIGLQHLESGALVASFVHKWNSHTTDCVDDFLEGTEVDVDLVIYRNAKVLFDGTNQTVWVLFVKVGVDAAAPC